MKKITSFLLSILFVVSLFMVESCVPWSKFREQKKKLANYEAENNGLISANEQLTVSNTELSANMAICRKELDVMAADSALRVQEIAALRKNSRQLENRLQEMNVTMDALKKGSEREASKLMMQIQGIQGDLQTREAELQKLSQEMADKQRNLLAMEQELDKRNRRMAELERLVSRQDSSVRALKNKVSAALVGLENNGLTVSMRQGKVYVSLEEKLLFKSGSIVVDPAGVSALKKLAKILEQNPDISITIEGHTDNVPLTSSASMQDNWDLSVKRATSIVRILLEGGRIASNRLTAAGRGEFIPVDAANTPAARQKNRRTEIILMPKLDELYQILE
ncbi:MAG: OmpA family protein [Bacteroidales bacterium]|jgi:chemotaxis protein MotB|nr:OmpA family protein [Bacteroidales bacterium]